MSQRDTGLTFSPQTVTASPAANMFLAAFMSRSWLVLHSGHVHCLLNSGILASTCPQFEQRLLDGYHLSILISSRPYQWALYSSCRKNSDQLASEMDLDRWRFFCMFFTDNVSTGRLYRFVNVTYHLRNYRISKLLVSLNPIGHEMAFRKAH